MTDPSDTPRVAPTDAPRALAHAAARLAVWVETLGPALGPALLGWAAFITCAWLGVFAAVPGPGWLAPMIALLGLALATSVSARRLMRIAKPAEGAALRRVERDAGVARRSLFHLEDQPVGALTPLAEALWRESQSRAAAERKKRRLRAARINWRRIDPHGMRWAALLALGVAGVVAGDARLARLGDALSLAPDRTGLRVDAWIEPPSYTGRAPVAVDWSADDPIATPQGSRVRVAVGGADRAPTLRAPGVAVRLAKRGGGHAGDAEIRESGRLSLAGRSVEIRVTPDEPPRAAFVGDPETDETGALLLPIFLDDDYAVIASRLIVRLAPGQSLGPDQPKIGERSLRAEEVFPLTARKGDRLAKLDAVEHPWAGLEATARLVAVDAAGQEGASEPMRITLPERAFQTLPAQAMIEQRRVLAVAEDDWSRPARAFNAIAIAPEIFAESYGEHLQLRRAFWRTMNGPVDQPAEGGGFEDVVSDLWSLALSFEDGAVETARRALEAAKEALRDALERGAPQAEIEGLVEQLRRAMANYIAALEASGQEPGDDSAAGDVMSPDELEERLRQIEELSRAGEGREARDVLAELSELLDALQSRSASSAGEGGEGEGGEGEQDPEKEALNELGDLIARQRALADETYAEENAPPVGPEARASAGERQGDLAGRQSDVADDAGAASDGLGAFSRDAADAVERAREAMAAAADALSDGEPGAAGAAQQEALDELRAAAAAVTEEADRRRQAEGEGAAGGEGGSRGERAGGVRDPLGRPVGRGPGQPNGLEATRAERARELLNQLRDRLADPDISPEERAYIERLLRRF